MNIKNVIIFLLIVLIAIFGTVFLKGSDNIEKNKQIDYTATPMPLFTTYKPHTIQAYQHPYKRSDTLMSMPIEPFYVFEDSFNFIGYGFNITGVIINGDTIKNIEKGRIILILEGKDGKKENWIFISKPQK